MKEQLNSRDLILLSAYLDGELDPRQKARVEALIQSNPQAREIYESLQRTKAVLRSAPLRKVPRNFTLTAAAVQPRRPLFLIPVLRFSSVLAALIAVWLFVGQLLPGMANRPLTASEPTISSLAAPERETVQMMAAPETEQQTPLVVYWGGPPPLPAIGKGGGMGSGCPAGFCGGAISPMDSIGRGGGSEQPLFQTPFRSETELGNILINPVATPIEPLPLEGSGPVLGVRQPEEQGKILYIPNQREPVPLGTAAPSVAEWEGASTPKLPAWLAIVSLAVLAIGLWLVSILIQRRTP